MKMRKVLSLVLAVAAMASGTIAMSSCGEDKQNTTTETGSGDVVTIKIGGTGPLTGDAAIYGTAAMNGAKIAVEEINALNDSFKFEFKEEDDQADGEVAVNAYNTLLDWGAQVIFGPVTTGAAISVSAQANQDRVFCLTPSASSTDVIEGKDNVFQICFTDPNQGIGSADYIAENMAGKKIAVIYRNDDAYSQGIRDTFVKEAAAKGLEISYEGTFTKDTSTDFSAQITAAKASGAEIVFLPIYYQPASVILKQAKDANYEPIFFGVDGMDGILTMEGFDPSLAEGVMLLTPFSADATDDKTVSFVAKYKEKYNEVPNQFAADGYDVIYTYYEAFKQAKVTASMSNTEICEALIAVMPTIQVDGLTGVGMTWSTDGAVSKKPRAVVISGGVYVTPEAK